MNGDNMPRIAEVFINIPTSSIHKPFSYAIPDALDYVSIGWRVLVSFGQRKSEGFIVKINEGDCADLKPILDALDTEPWFNSNMLQTALWISEYYMCTLSEAMRLFIPGKSGIKTDTIYSVNPDVDEDKLAAFLNGKPEEYHLLYKFMQDNKAVNRSSVHKLLGKPGNKILHELLNKHYILVYSSAKKKGNSKYTDVISLTISKETAAALSSDLKGKYAQQRLLAALIEEGQLSSKQLRYLKISKTVVQKLSELHIIRIDQQQIYRDSYQELSGLTTSSVKLNSYQISALDRINPAIENKIFQSFLLHGITGSGKTQVYIEAVFTARRLNRQAIVVVPEIALTGQTVQRFKRNFGDDVVVMHSKLSVGERYDAWQRIRNQEAGIVIGARSAIFAPVKDLGIIIIDEEHEFTYKQEETPRYHTREVALNRAQLSQAIVVLGSATPSIETYYNTLLGKHVLLEMPERVDSASLPPVTLVDMREELSQGKRNVISLPLQELLLQTLAKGEQAIILLNRRGYATFVICRECGHVMRCSHCTSSLVYHAKENRLRCHYCQKSEPVPDVCPKCLSRYIRYFGTGTQKLEDELVKLLPKARIARMDRDTTSNKHAYDKILNDFASGKYDILMGTQMVAKGHDVSNVTAVGIISVDTVLNLPDFRAAERAFSLLTQAAGRAGRGNRPGNVVVQAYTPEHYAIQSGAQHDYHSFYQQEIVWRKELNYPPFTHLVKITVQSTNEDTSRRLAEDFTATLRQHIDFAESQIIGPFNAAVYKVKDVFRINILLKTLNLTKLRKTIVDLNLLNRREITIDIDPVNVM